MNEIDAQVIALIGRFVAAIVALILGALFVRWGTNLYLTGIKGKSGTIKTILKDAQFILTNGAPGTFLSAGGVIVMVTALLTMPGYDQGKVASARPKSPAADSVQQFRSAPVAASVGEEAIETALSGTIFLQEQHLRDSLDAMRVSAEYIAVADQIARSIEGARLVASPSWACQRRLAAGTTAYVFSPPSGQLWCPSTTPESQLFLNIGSTFSLLATLSDSAEMDTMRLWLQDVAPVSDSLPKD
jgi:hypothetical protein